MNKPWKFFILMAAVVLALSPSCSREQTTPEKEGPSSEKTKIYTLRATLGETVKTTVSPTGSVTWEAGDKIAVWDSKSGSYCIFTTVDGDGLFSFEGQDGVEYTFTEAVYPAIMAKSPGTVTLPAEYSAQEALSGALYPMTGVVDDATVAFKQLGALLRINVIGIPAEATNLVVSSPQVALSGDFKIVEAGTDSGLTTGEGEDFTDGGTLTVKSAGTTPSQEIRASSGEGTVTVNLTPGDKKNAVIYCPLPIGAFSCTFTVNNGTTALKQVSTPTLKDIKRKKMVRVNCVVSGFEGTGTPADPYIIEDKDGLILLSSLVSSVGFESSNYKLSGDLDMTGEESFDPIGTKAYPFSGSFDGDGHTIKNLKLNVNGGDVGLFGYVKGGTVKGLVLEGATVSGTGDNAGAVAGVLDGGLIQGCRTDAATYVQAGASVAGSIVGLVKGGTVRDCAAHGQIVVGANYAGGIAGYLAPAAAGSDALVINCVFDPVYIDGKMSASHIKTSSADAYMGGIAGAAFIPSGLDSKVRIANCYAYPLLLESSQTAGTKVNYIGGILGFLSGNITVYNCITPVTYSNILVGSTRLNATTIGTYNTSSCVVGYVSEGKATIVRGYSKNTWPGCYRIRSGVAIEHSDISLRMGDGNMRGYSSVVYSTNHAITGVKSYSEAEGGILAALNAGVTLWNAENPDALALTWAYDPTLGYPKPQGVDVAGLTTIKVTIMGDSISTYQGYVFSNDDSQMSKHYPQTSDIQEKYAPQVWNEQLTWWWKLIYDKMSNARLEVNNAWGGTTVSYVPQIIDGMNPSAGAASYQQNSQQKRYFDYGAGNPDVLISFGGRNDFAYIGNNSNVLLGQYTDEALQAAYDAPEGTLYNNYSQGNIAILKDFHSKHPSAKIILMITDLMNDDYEASATAITEFLSAKGYNIRFVNLHKTGTVNTENTDIGVSKEQGSHPNATGCDNIANYIWSQVGQWLQN